MTPVNDDATVEHPVGERLPPPIVATDDVVVAAPPEVTQHAPTNQLVRYLPIVTAVATLGVMAAAYSARSTMMRNPAFMMLPLMMVVSSVATVLANGDRRRAEINVRRAEYLAYLSEIRATARSTALAQHYSASWSHPDPDTLWTLVGGRRMWERSAADPDHGMVRVGLGRRPLATRLIPAGTENTHRLDPVGAAALDRFLAAHSTVSNLPIAVALCSTAAVHISGDEAQARALVRAIICQLAVMHSATTVVVAAAAGDHIRSYWEWLKWLPHNRHPFLRDDLGPGRMVYRSLAASREALGGVLDERHTVPHIVVVVDGVDDVDDTRVDGATFLLIAGAADSAPADTTVLQLSPREMIVRSSNDNDVVVQPDQLSHTAALACAQRLAGYRPAPVNASSGRTDWLHLVGISDVTTFAPTARPSGTSRLRVPIGTTSAGTPIELDIKEAAENGMGPHGICIGATGSGKSELLRTVVLGMIVGHSPEDLNLVLVDFKGGATFAGLGPAPHVAAVITNLSDKAALVTRMRDALMGEMNRRQEMLREAGNLDSIAAYRRAGARLGPLPALFIVVDEFSELLSQQPDFVEVFGAIGRLGRSLGMHLLLASQRLDEGRLRGLESHLSYRICLKTLSGNESRMVLGTSDAYELPGAPGAAYLRVGTHELIRFQTACVSMPAGSRPVAGEPAALPPADVALFTVAAAGPETVASHVGPDLVDRPTILQAMVERLVGIGPPAHEVWLPPLSSPPALSVVLRDAEPIPAMTAVVGVVDRPFEQRRTPMLVDLSGAAGNVALVGAPQSGKSTAIRTLITALAVTHDPRFVQFYCLDFGGGALASLRDWPHVGSVAARADPERVRRTIARLEALVRSRETLFREHGIESMVHYRQRKAGSDPECDGFGDVFLIVDGWLNLQRELDDAEASITALAGSGLSYGVHVVLSASRWAEIRPALRDQIGTRIELRLGDPSDSEVDRRRAQQVPDGQPGRGLTHDGLQMVIAAPVLDGDPASSLADAAARIGQMLRNRHGGWSAPPIPLLPTRIGRDTVLERADNRGSEIILGVEENDLRTAAVDFTGELHLLILGDNDCGKTATLRTVCVELLRTTTAAQTRLVIVDPRRALLGVVEPESGQLGGYLASPDAVAEGIPQVAEVLRRRMPPSTATPTQLRDRSWWQGPDLYLVIDDYDLVAAPGTNPLSPLLEMLPYARDVGLHLVVARRSSGAARAMFEPLLAGLRDAGCMTLLMSGSSDDGLAIGSVRPSPLPPGRGVLITRRGDPLQIQVGWTPAP